MIPVVPTVPISTAHLGGWLVDAFPKYKPFVGECPGGRGCEGWEKCSVCDATCWVIPANKHNAKVTPYRGSTGPGKDPRAVHCTHCKFRGWEACLCNDPIHMAIVLGVRVAVNDLQIALDDQPLVIRACVDDGCLCLPKRNPLRPTTLEHHAVLGVVKRYDARTLPLPLEIRP